MKNTTLYLIRHGPVENPQNIIYGRTDLPLSPSGVSHIENTAQKLKEQGIVPTAIISSPLRRADETAKIFADGYGIPHKHIAYRNDIQEVDFGEEIVGKPFSFFAEVNDDLFTHNVEGKPRSRETPEQFTERNLAALREITDAHQGETVFVVGHGDPLSFALRELRHPGKPLPSVVYLEQNGMYLEKGDIGRVIINEKNGVERIDLLRLRDGTLHVEGYPEDMDHNPSRRK